MTSRRTIVSLLLLSAVVALVIVRGSHPRADEDEEEKPVTSSAARVTHAANGQVVIALPPAAQKEIGIVTEILKPAIRPLEVEAYGFVLDPAPLSKLNADLAGGPGRARGLACTVLPDEASLCRPEKRIVT